MSISCWAGGHYWAPISQFTWLCEMRLGKAGRDHQSPGLKGGRDRERGGGEISTPEGGTADHQESRAGFNTKIICNHCELELKIWRRRNILSGDFKYHYLERLHKISVSSMNVIFTPGQEWAEGRVLMGTEWLQEGEGVQVRGGGGVKTTTTSRLLPGAVSRNTNILHWF